MTNFKLSNAGRGSCFEKGKRSFTQGQEEINTMNAKKEENTSRPDCLSCRITGTVVCLGLSAYLTLHTYAKPPTSPAQRIFTLAFAGGFAALGVARALV
jgi:hypothetical protein